MGSVLAYSGISPHRGKARPQNRETFRLSPGYVRYLLRHAVEQKCSSCPFTVSVTLAPVDTYVPHTGSFFKSPPRTTLGAEGGGGWRVTSRLVWKRLRKNDRRRAKTNRGRRISRSEERHVGKEGRSRW